MRKYKTRTNAVSTAPINSGRISRVKRVKSTPIICHMNSLSASANNNSIKARLSEASSVHSRNDKSKRTITKPLNLADFVISPNPNKKRKQKKTLKSSNNQLISNKIKPSGNDNGGPYCLPTCKYSGRDAAESMVRCCICMLWVHPVSCCGDSVEDPNHVGMYTCSICRKLPQRLSSIESTIEQLHDLNKHLIQMLETKEKECLDLKEKLAMVYNNNECLNTIIIH